MEEKINKFSDVITGEQKARIMAGIEESAYLENENDFVKKMLPTLKYIFGIRAENLAEFEKAQRRQMYERNPNMIELNQMLAYELEGDEIRLHVPSNEASTIKDMLRFFKDGFRKMAEILEQHPEVKTVIGRSWIIGKNPLFFEKLGFIVSERDTSPNDGREWAVATISRERLLEFVRKMNERKNVD